MPLEYLDTAELRVELMEARRAPSGGGRGITDHTAIDVWAEGSRFEG